MSLQPRQPALQLIVAFSTGSASDDIASLIAPPLAAALERRVVITRIAGDNGTLGARMASQSPPDGNTLFVATLGTHALAPHLNPLLPYDPQYDFVPVSLLTQSPMLLACHPALPVPDVQALIAHARAHPGELAYGASAIGGAPHLAAALFQSVTGVQLRHARYAETGKLYADLEAGVIALSFNNMMSMLPRCKAGRLRALAATSAERCPVAPNVPTLAEAGVSGSDVSNWLGLSAPRGTPRMLVDTISQAVARVLQSADIAGRLTAAGITPHGSTPEAFGEFLEAQLQRWQPVVARFNQQ